MIRGFLAAVLALTFGAGAVAAAPPPPAKLDDDGVKAWLKAYIKSEGWTLITADGSAVVFGSPNGVAREADGALTTELRHEYYGPDRLGPMDTRSNLQTWTVDCEQRRILIRAMTIFPDNNLQGTAQSRTWSAPEWVAITAGSTRARTIDRICAAPTTGQPLK